MNNTPLLAYVINLVELNRLDKIGMNDSEQADVVRERMDYPYSKLTKEQIRLVNILAASLNEERDPIGYPLAEQFCDITKEEVTNR